MWVSPRNKTWTTLPVYKQMHHYRGLKTWNILWKKKDTKFWIFLMQTWVHQISRAHSSWENFNQVVSRPISYVAMSRCQKSRFYDLCMIFFYSVLVLIGPIWLFTCDSPTVNATVHTNSIIYSLLYYFFQTKMIFQIQLNRSD